MADSPEKAMAANKQKYLTNPGSVTRFPSEEIPYKMLLNFKAYSYTASQGGLIDSSSNVKQMDSGSVILPLPLQLNDTTSINADNASSGLAALASGVLSGGFSVNNILDAIKGDVPDNMQAYSKILAESGAAALLGSGALGGKTALAAKVVGGVAAAAGTLTGSDAYAQIQGKVTNSFETMQFKGVKLKQHSFNWRLSPSSAVDSERLRSIINQIKKNILPAYIAVSGPAQFGNHALLQYPKIAFVSFYGIDQEFYYKLKPCMITQFSVRYNGGEQLNIYKGGKPAVVDMSMDLVELTIHSTEDYGGSYQPSASDYSAAIDTLNNIQSAGNNGNRP